MPHSHAFCPWWAPLLIIMLLSACSVGPQGRAASHYYAFPPDSVTNTCIRGTANCPVLMGEATAAAVRTRVAEAGASIGGAILVVEYLKRSEVEQALAHCTLYAQEKVNNQHFNGRSPTREQCQQVVGTDTHRKPVTRAMQLGLEKHQAAMECLKWRLELLIPGQFSLEPRYRYNSQTKEKSLISSNEVRQLLEAGRGAELTGTIAPDIVIHLGEPLWPKAIYELKFPCPDSNPVRWRQYPEGHPHAGKTQQTLYKEALGVDPLPVTPLRGIIR